MAAIYKHSQSITLESKPLGPLTRTFVDKVDISWSWQSPHNFFRLKRANPTEIRLPRLNSFIEAQSPPATCY